LLAGVWLAGKSCPPSLYREIQALPLLYLRVLAGSFGGCGSGQHAAGRAHRHCASLRNPKRPWRGARARAPGGQSPSVAYSICARMAATRRMSTPRCRGGSCAATPSSNSSSTGSNPRGRRLVDSIMASSTSTTAGRGALRLRPLSTVRPNAASGILKTKRAIATSCRTVCNDGARHARLVNVGGCPLIRPLARGASPLTQIALAQLRRGLLAHVAARVGGILLLTLPPRPGYRPTASPD
jgi:hypothetical protein